MDARPTAPDRSRRGQLAARLTADARRPACTAGTRPRTADSLGRRRPGVRGDPGAPTVGEGDCSRSTRRSGGGAREAGRVGRRPAGRPPPAVPQGGARRVAATTPKGRTLGDAAGAGCALLTAHTNADQAVGGVSEALAHALGLTDLRAARGRAATARLDKLTVYVPVGRRRPGARGARRGRRRADRRLRQRVVLDAGRGPVPAARRAPTRRSARSAGSRWSTRCGSRCVLARAAARPRSWPRCWPPTPTRSRRTTSSSSPTPGVAATGTGRIGDGRAETTLARVRRRRVADALPETAHGVRVAGDPDRVGAPGRGVRRSGRLPARRGARAATPTSTSPATCGTTRPASSSSTAARRWSTSRTGRPSGPGCRWWRRGCAEALGDTVETRVSTICTDPWTASASDRSRALKADPPPSSSCWTSRSSTPAPTSCATSGRTLPELAEIADARRPTRAELDDQRARRRRSWSTT